MTQIVHRRAFVCVTAGALANLATWPRLSRAQTRPMRAIYPVALPNYQVLYVAQRKGFFKDEGLDVQLTQGGSGTKMREIVASGEGDVGMGDITHPLQLTNRNRPAKILNAVDTRAGGVFIVGAEPARRGATDLPRLATYKRADARKPIVGVSSLGGTSHVWATFFLEQMKLERAFTFVGVGDTSTMLGALKTQQIDCLVLSPSALAEAQSHGWGQLLFDEGAPANWDKYVGGNVPVTVTFALQSTIERDPARVQAFVGGMLRSARWIAGHSAEEIYEQIEPFVGSASRASNLVEIAATKQGVDVDGRIDDAAYARGGKVYFREMTGIQPLPLASVYAREFIDKAHGKAGR